MLLGTLVFRWLIPLLFLFNTLTAQAVTPKCAQELFSLSWPTGEDFYRQMPQVLKDPTVIPSKLAKKMGPAEIEELANFLMRPALNLDPTNIQFAPHDEFLSQKSAADKIILYPLATVEYGAKLLRRIDRLHGTMYLLKLGQQVLSMMPVAGDYRSDYLHTVLDFFRDDKTYRQAPVLLLTSLTMNREALEEIGNQALTKDISRRNFNPPVLQVVRALEKLERRKIKLTEKETLGLRAITAHAKTNISIVGSDAQKQIAEENIRTLDRLINSVSS